MGSWAGYVSSVLLGTEAIRACARHEAGYAQDAREWLSDVAMLPLTDSILDAAASLRPAGLRSLDALHLATALSVRDDVGVFLSYDDRLAEAAREHGLRVAQPGT
jgi:uncharacterized protein